MDKKIKKVQKHIEAIMEILEIEKTASNEKTPYRVAKMYCNELFSSLNNNGFDEFMNTLTTFPAENSGFPVTVKDISFSSVCEHHWLPFMGKVTVTYIPDEKIIGLSKIPRIIKYFSRRPQVQERFTEDIGNFLFDYLKPKYVKVSVTAIHTCVQCRGAESECETVTVFERKSDSYAG